MKRIEGGQRLSAGCGSCCLLSGKRMIPKTERPGFVYKNK